MTNKEFSDGFSTLLNSFGNLPNITLDEYEKSVFLTNAQEQLIIDLYSGRNPLYGKSFEQTEEIRRYLSSLVKTYETTDKVSGELGLTDNSIFFLIPTEAWFITYESATLKDESLGCLDGTQALVVPMTQDDLYKALDNPFRGPTKDRVLRLDVQGSLVELISKYNIQKYLVRYLSKPAPIILVDLPVGLSINGTGTRSSCELSPVIHRAILDRAVQLAIISKTQLTSKE